MTEIKENESVYAPKFSILYEDNHIIVVLKPQMTACCPDESKDDNLFDQIKAYVKTAYNKPGNVYLGLVHRLDRPTGGVMVYAKTSKAAARLTAGLQSGDFEKKYLDENFKYKGDFEKLIFPILSRHFIYSIIGDMEGTDFLCKIIDIQR